MKYKEFVSWCSDRAADGYWSDDIAMFCINIIKDIKSVKWWKRNKYWEENFEQDIVEQLVKPINNHIEKILLRRLTKHDV